jgi:hypothetical protein
VEFIEENGGGPRCPVTKAATEERVGSYRLSRVRVLGRGSDSRFQSAPSEYGPVE